MIRRASGFAWLLAPAEVWYAQALRLIRRRRRPAFVIDRGTRVGFGNQTASTIGTHALERKR